MTEPRDPSNIRIKKTGSCMEQSIHLLAIITITLLQASILYVLRDAHYSISQVSYTDPQYKSLGL